MGEIHVYIIFYCNSPERKSMQITTPINENGCTVIIATRQCSFIKIDTF